MYVKADGRTYYKGTEQRCSRGLFLILLQSMSDSEAPIKAVLRKVALRQCGPWMIGKAKIFGYVAKISGAYGSDGHPVTVPSEIYRQALLIPPSLIKMWQDGGGWNGPGSEAEMMREWALAHEETLSPKKAY